MILGALALVASLACADRDPVGIEVDDLSPSLSTTAASIPIAELRFRGFTGRLGVGEQVTLRAFGRDSRGREVPLPSGVRWSVSGNARIDASGRLTGESVGGITITAQYGSHRVNVSGRITSASVMVRVTGDTVVALHASATGGTAAGRKFTARVTDAKGSTLSGRTVRWSSSDARVLRIDAQSGEAFPVAAGTATVIASSGSATGRLGVRVTAEDAPPPQPTPTPAPVPSAPSGGGVELLIKRLAGGSGEVLVSNGIPLPPGRLRASDLGRVRILVGGQELPVYVEALKGKHADGSLRSILVQFRTAVGGTPVSGTLETGAPRTAATLAETPITAKVPAAVALPRSADYLMSTNLIGPTTSAERSAAHGGAFREYESDFVSFSTAHLRDGDNYYDRALNHYAYWIRTGDPVYWERATDLAYKHRDRHFTPKGTSPHGQQMEGVVLHYWLTGDERSRMGVLNQAAPMANYARADIIGPRGRYREGRIAARALMAAVLAWQLELDGVRPPDGRPRDFRALAGTAVDLSVAAFLPDGRYMGTVCGRELNYMTGLLHSALIFYYRNVTPDPRIPATIKRSLDYLWRTQWMPAKGGFQYWDAPYRGARCETKREGVAAVDLNMMMVMPFGWYGQVSGDRTYFEKGDWIFKSAVEGAWISGAKQFNQQYYNSYEYLGYRFR